MHFRVLHLVDALQRNLNSSGDARSEPRPVAESALSGIDYPFLGIIAQTERFGEGSTSKEGVKD
jgi:hypothetical protein